ncbi:MBL fold metallo-hydrolase [Thermoanaerobacterium sp. RBIITD]|uniref:MBL fold metallo-hydrolase n=1 Tax=Thermoanaerobacterium sp. RBIITD TaxID=1550240 RepID=UPI000BB9B2CA|nr:MBL fold metallo-hydrolase [Thermoanaerobacterium sp. RBIITD]SNX52643.1 Glyoxylase, beta-lactamase superfamily II [Thermoanaerobacterium sp. RBIITD]
MNNNLKIQRFIIGPLQSNCYVVVDPDTKECVVIDPGEPINEIPDYIIKNGYKPKYVLLTHGHLDHIGGVDFLRDRFDVKVCISEDDSKMLSDPHLNLSMMDFERIVVKPADILLKDGDVLKFGDKKINVIHTPGHTPGGSCFRIGEVCFTGDTLFNGSIGRTDFPGGNYNDIMESIKNKLFKLNDDVIICPGHGETSTIGYEKTENPFL